MRSPGLNLPVFFVLTFATACVADGGSITVSASGDDSVGDDGDDATASGDTAAATLSGTDAGTDAGTDDGTDDEGSTATGGTGPLCSDFLGEGPGTPVEFTVVNSTAATIYLDWTWGLAPMTLQPPGVSLRWFNFGTSCAKIVGPSNDLFCGEGVPVPQVLRIDPGASFSYDWDGVLHDSVPLPLSCVHPDHEGQWPCEFESDCGVPHTPPEGSYAAELEAYPEVVSRFGRLVDCTGAACILSDAYTVGRAMMAAVTFDYPSATVQIVF